MADRNRERIYWTYKAMRDRCYNKKNKYYCNYGARGISICDLWLNSFNDYLHWYQSNYKIGMTVDRIDNNGDYCPENCKFSTVKEQNKNRRPIIRSSNFGTTKKGSKWQAVYKRKYIGLFSTRKSATKAVLAAERRCAK